MRSWVKARCSRVRALSRWVRAQRRRVRALSCARANRVAAGRRALERGTATAEYAIATLAACAFAGMLLAILRSGEVRGLLFGLVRRALSVG